MTTGAKVLVAGALIVVMTGIGAAGFLAGRGAGTLDGWASRIFGEGETTTLGPVTISTMRELAQLTTYELVEYTLVEQSDDRGWLNWATGDSVSMFVVARIGAGVDLASMGPGSVESDPATGVAVIRIPGAEIAYVEVDEEQTHVYDRDTGIFTSGDPNLERAARLAAQEILVGAALDRGLLELAETEAQLLIQTFVESLGYVDVEVIIEG
jgi:hypothetical protein